LTLPEIARQWPGVLDRIKGTAFAYLKSARCVGLKGNALILEVESQFHRDGLASPEIKSSVEAALSVLAGQQVAIDLRAGSAAEPAAWEVARPGPRPSVAPVPGPGPTPGSAIPHPPAVTLPDWVEQEPLVKTALEVFKARIVGLKRP